MFVLVCQVHGEEPEVGAANDLSGFNDGGAFVFVSEIKVNQMDGAFVAKVVVVLGFALLVECGFALRANLTSVSDAEPVVEFFDTFTGASESKKVVKARRLSDECSAVR